MVPVLGEDQAVEEQKAENNAGREDGKRQYCPGPRDEHHHRDQQDQRDIGERTEVARVGESCVGPSDQGLEGRVVPEIAQSDDPQECRVGEGEPVRPAEQPFSGPHASEVHHRPVFQRGTAMGSEGGHARKLQAAKPGWKGWDMRPNRARVLQRGQSGRLGGVSHRFRTRRDATGEIRDSRPSRCRDGMRLRLSYLWIFGLDANMPAMARSLSCANECARSLAQACPRCRARRSRLVPYPPAFADGQR